MASQNGSYMQSEILILNEMYRRGLRSKRQKDLLEEATKKTGLETMRVMVIYL